ncbi:MAG: TIGR03905 family TSCPD domain-containing protein [Spirochaetia bacterium]|nr:TIGR03905 family TSCPD domain-containing protein [Spirochaetia bacterium]
MKDYTIPTKNICPRSISFSIEDGKVYNIKFQGGCPGNTKAIAKLLEGADAQYIVDKLKGNDCGGKGTSCADQLARGVEKALAEQPA